MEKWRSVMNVIELAKIFRWTNKYTHLINVYNRTYCDRPVYTTITKSVENYGEATCPACILIFMYSWNRDVRIVKEYQLRNNLRKVHDHIN